MSEAANTSTTVPDATSPAPGTATPAGEEKTYVPPATQADLDRIIESRLARERAKYEGFDEFKQKAAQLDQQAEASKTELQKATERAEKAERQLAALQHNQLRLEVAAAKGLPASAAARLQGTTREELEADADDFAALVKPGQPANGLRIEPPVSGNAQPTSNQSAARAFFGI